MMDKLTRALLDDRQLLVDALTAIRDGHKAGLDFLKLYTPDAAPSHLPKTLRESIEMAEIVACAALSTVTLDTFAGPLLRSMLLLYGRHFEDCPAFGNVEDECQCSWQAIIVRLTENAETNSEGKVIP